MSDQTVYDTPEQFGTDEEGVVKRWLAELDLAGREYKQWEMRVERIIKRYRDDRTDSEAARSNRRRYNIMWSTIEVLKPALYSQTPHASVRRRFHDPDPVGRVAAEMWERAVEFGLDTGSFDHVMRMCRNDYLLAGRGQAWVRYEPVITEGSSIGDDDQSANDPLTDQEMEPEMQVEWEEVVVDHVPWKDFRHSTAPEWSKVTWVARRSYMTKKAVEERFDTDIAAKLNYNNRRPGVTDDEMESDESLFGRAEIWEIWDKINYEVLWIAKDYPDKPLDKEEDPLGLQDFFPCPRPLYATLTTDSLIPIPDYSEYQDQAKELDDLSERISTLVRGLKLTGVYAGSNTDVARMLSEDTENELIPVDEWTPFIQQGGVRGAIDFFPVDTVAEVISGLYQAREQVKADLYEITGMSDILRGYTAPQETATAQQIKSNFASLRLSERQRNMAQFARDVLALKAEIIAEHFSDEHIRLISGYDQSHPLSEAQVSDPTRQLARETEFQSALELIRSDKLRTFRLEVETDATVEADAQQEKEMRTEFLTAVGAYLQQSIPAVMQVPQVAPMLLEMLMFGVRGFPIGRELEQVFEDAVQQFTGEEGNQLQQQLQQQQQQSAATEQGKLQLQQQKMQLDAQVAQANVQLKEQQLQLQAMKDQFEMQLKAATAQHDAQMGEMRLMLERALGEMKIMSAQKVAAAQIEQTAETDTQRIKSDERIAAAQIEQKGEAATMKTEAEYAVGIAGLQQREAERSAELDQQEELREQELAQDEALRKREQDLDAEVTREVAEVAARAQRANGSGTDG